MSERYCTNFRIIYDNDKKMTLEEVVERLNSQEALLTELTKEGDFDILIGIMQDNNLTLGAVVNIIEEALNESI